MSVLLTILQLFPTILQAILAIEAALPNASGATKKAVLMSAITTQPISTANASAASALTDNLVATLNQTGVFAHVQPPSIAPVTKAA